jgi:tetratricopeptide (TPR) repeat protein
MKRLITISAILVASIAAHAQGSKVLSAWNYINYYNNGEGPENLEKGVATINEAALNESTMNQGKTWWYRAQIYTLIFLDKDLKTKHPESSFEAVASYKKLYELNDAKFKDWEDVFKYLLPIGNNIFNAGVDNFQSKNYADAAKYFYAIKDVNAVIEGKGKKAPLDLGTALKNAAISAENSGNADLAIKIHRDWIAAKPEAIAYANLAKTYKKQGNLDEAKKVVDEGIVKFPKESVLLVEKINFYLEADNAPEALTYINAAIEAEPTNDMLYFVKGLAFEKSGNEAEIIAAYNKALEVNPKNFKALYNLGALYFNKAGKLTEQMNNLNNTAADMKKFEELKKQRTALFAESKPYFERAKAIDPDDAQNNRTLKQIELYTAE